MARPIRLEYPGAVWHVHNRGNNFADIFFSDADRELFLSLLEETARRFHWVVIQFCLMTTHFHLLVETPVAPTLSRGMKWMTQTYVQRINRRYSRVGTLFQGRFKGHLVEKSSYLLEAIRYIANNPVAAGIVASADDWTWGSHRGLAGLETVPSWMSGTPALQHFGPDGATQRREYRRFVDAGAGIKQAPWENAVAGLFVGSAEWVASMRELLESKPRSTEHPIAQRYAGRPHPSRIVEVVAEVFETTAEAIRSAHGTIEREVVAWLGCYEAVARHGAIAATLRLRSPSRVSALIAKCDRNLRDDPALRDRLDRCLDLLRRDSERLQVRHRESYPSVAVARF